MTRRRALLARPESPNEYVMSGLVLWLDGINKGDTANAWTDLVGGHVFEAHNGVTFNQDHLTFARARSQYMTNTSFNVPASDVGTIEIVHSCDMARYIVFMPKTNNSLCFGRYDNYLIYTSDPVKRSITQIGSNIGYFSFSDLNRIVNGESYRNNNMESWLSANDVNYIGCRRGSEHLYTGDIYCIRIYNRQLSSAEVFRNYAIDQSRFHLAI